MVLRSAPYYKFTDLQLLALSDAERGFLNLLNFFKNNEGVIDPANSPKYNEKIQAVQEKARVLQEDIMHLNTVVASALSRQQNIFKDLDPFFLKLIVIQLSFLGFLVDGEAGGQILTNRALLNDFRGIKFPINIFFVPKQIITSEQIERVFKIITMCTNPLELLTEFLSDYFATISQDD